jgi:hypothetical protein
MGDGIDPQPPRLAAADAAIEQIDLFGDFLEQRVERLVQELEPGDLGVVQVERSRYLPEFLIEDDHLRLSFPQSSSASRFTAGAAGFLNFSQSFDRPEQ